MNSIGLKFAVLLLALSLTITAAAALREPGWMTVPALLFGWFAADMLSGLIHMLMDYHPCPHGKGLDQLYFYRGSRESDEYQALLATTMRQVNPFERLAYDFKNHHPRPDALGRRTMLRQIGSSVIVGALPTALMFNLWCWLVPTPSWIAAAMLSFLIGGTFAQYFHGTLHRAQNPAPIAIMRRLGLLMSPAAHQLHHDTLRRDFATNCGWSNAVLNPVFAWLHARAWLRDEALEPGA